MDGEGSGLFVDGDGEGGLSVRLDDRSGVARLLIILYFGVSVRFCDDSRVSGRLSSESELNE